MRNQWLARSPYLKIPSRANLDEVIRVGFNYWNSANQLKKSSWNFSTVDLSIPTVIPAQERLWNAISFVGNAVQKKHPSHAVDWLVVDQNVVTILEPASQSARYPSGRDLDYWGRLLGHYRVFTYDMVPKNCVLIGGGADLGPTLGYYGGIAILHLPDTAVGSS